MSAPSIKEQLYERTIQFSVRVLAMLRTLKKGMYEEEISRQLARSAMSVGANYREACHAQSRGDFVHKIKICEGEAEESLYWMEIIVRSGMVSERRMSCLIAEATELISILTASAKTARSHLNDKRGRN